MRSRSALFVTAFAATSLLVANTHAGDRYWSLVEGLTNVRDFAVCGNTVYAASDNGLFRNIDGAEVWQQLRTAPSDLVACDGNRVFWLEMAPPDYIKVLYISHDALQTVTQSTGLLNPDPEDLAIAGNIDEWS